LATVIPDRSVLNLVGQMCGRVDRTTVHRWLREHWDFHATWNPAC